MRIIVLLIIGLFALWLWMGIGGNKQGTQPAAQRAATPPAAAQPAAGPRFELVDSDTEDTPIKAQVEQHLVVLDEPGEQDLRQELQRRWLLARDRRGWRHHDRTTNVYIYIYESAEQARAGQAAWLAMLAWTIRDNQPRVQVNQERLQAFGRPPEQRFGLSEEQRRSVWRELIAAEDRATNEAMARIPDTDINAQIDLERRLIEEYRHAVLAKWNLDADQASAIGSEAWERGWTR